MNLESGRLGAGLCEVVYAKDESHAIAAERVLLRPKGGVLSFVSVSWHFRQTDVTIF